MQQMKKINFFTFDDILQKRTLRSFNKKQSNAFNRNNKMISFQQDDDVEVNQNQLLMNVMEEFKATNKNSQTNFSNQIKTHVVEVMSKKMNLHLNASKIIPKMKIKKTQQIEIIEKINTKNHEVNGILQAKKIESLIRRSSKCLLQPKRLSYFVLSGSIHIFEKQQQHSRKKNHDQEQPSNEVSFFNWKQFEFQHPGFKKVKTYGQFTGFGNAFSLKLSHDQSHEYKGQNLANSSHPSSQQLTKNPQFVLAQGSIFVQIENPQAGDDFINHMGMDYDKMTQAIIHFSVFKSLGKKIHNFVQFFEFKEYLKNQQIYSIGDEVKKFYLLLKGEVVFEHNNVNHVQTAVTSPIGSRKSSSHMHITIKTETMSSGSYFGQEEIILEKSQRTLTARCKSPKSHMLQISIDKFKKMLEYSDFHDCIKKAAQIKFQQRFQKLEKNQEIRNKFAFSQSKDDKFEEGDLISQMPSENQTVPLFGSPKRSFDGKFKMMHGNMIRQFTQQQKQRMGETVQFSMLKVNPDMYEKTVDKFRKYNIKPAQKYKPQISWQLKRVWKVLNLENILRQQTEINSPEGRKFYDSHQRYMYHLKESKSMRPKTTSSTYRTKLQYIAYLQQFKGDNK